MTALTQWPCVPTFVVLRHRDSRRGDLSQGKITKKPLLQHLAALVDGVYRQFHKLILEILGIPLSQLVHCSAGRLHEH